MRPHIVPSDDYKDLTSEPPETPESDGENCIVVYDRGPSYLHIEQALRLINLTAIPGLLPEGETSTIPLKTARMNIVNENVPGALERCNELSPTLPTLLLTRDISFESRLSAVRAGVDGLLKSPVAAEDITGWLNHFGRQNARTKASILLIDDDELISAVYAAKLRGAGMAVSCATNAKTAFGFLERNDFDLILLDIQMPDVDGLEFVRIVRQSIENLSLPIIFLSSEKDPAKQLEARKFGGDYFIVKPVSPEQLLTLTQVRLERARDLRGLMDRDSLTGLLNHAKFKLRLDQEMERARRTGAEVCLAIVDIDNFKSINDTYGHPVGDRVISAIANLLTSSLRKIDVVGRYGGEEFGVILLDTPIDEAHAVIDRIRTAFSEMRFEADDRNFSVTFSGGICSSNTTLDGEEIIALADSALYQAKKGGRDMIVKHQAPRQDAGT